MREMASGTCSIFFFPSEEEIDITLLILGKICHKTRLKGDLCFKPLKKSVFATGHYKIVFICQKTLPALFYSI